MNIYKQQYKPLLLLAAPMILGQIASISMNIVDTVMAGHYDAAALGAIAVGGSLWSLVLLFTLGLFMSVQTLVSQYDGAGQRDRSGHLVRQACWIAVGLGLISILILSNIKWLLHLFHVDPVLIAPTQGYLSAICWGAPALYLFLVLRFMSEGLSLTRPSMYFGILGLLINIPANYVLMFGQWGFPELGAVGCGIASALVCWVQFIGLVVYMYLKSDYQECKLFESFDWPKKTTIKLIIAIGLPIGISVFLESSLFTTAALLVGSMGVNAVAGHQIAINFASFVFMVPLGLAMAITVRVGNAAGRNDFVEARRRANSGISLTLMGQLVSSTIMIVFPAVIASLYTDDAEVLGIAVSLISMAAIFQISDGLQASTAGALRGVNDTRLPMLITAVAYWGFGIPVSYYLGQQLKMGPQGIWIGMISGLSVAAGLLYLRLHRLDMKQSIANYRID